MNLFILITTCIINLVFGASVLLRDSRKDYARLFGLMSVFITIWIITNYMTDHYFDHLWLTNLANKLAYFSGYATVVSGLLFTYVFPVRRTVRTGEVVLVGALAFLPSVLSFTTLIAGNVTLPRGGGVVYSTGPLIGLYVVCFMGLLVLLSRNLLGVMAHRRLAEKQQAWLILVAFVSSAFLGLLLNVIVPSMLGYGWHTTQIGPLVTVILVGTIAYTIVRHGLFDVRLAIVRTFAYVLSLFTLASVYYLLALTLSATLLSSDHSAGIQNPIGIVLALTLAFVFQPLKLYFDKLTSRVFYRNNYNSDDFFTDLSRELSTTTDLRSLLQRAAAVISLTFHAEQSFFFVEYGENNRYITAGTSRHSQLDKTDVELINAYATDGDGAPIITSRLVTQNELSRILSRHNIELVLPLKWGEGMLSYLFLGLQRSRDYTRRDIQVLETVSDELAIAIQNALSLHEVKEINATLQERIASATKELRESNVQLQRLDEAKDEFVSMASHQLRTPLTSVKGYISMVLEGDAGKISPTQTKLLQEAFTSSERMVHLINDFLNMSRLQTGKFMIDKRAIDLSKIIGEEVASLDSTATAHSLKLRYRAPSYFPILYLDEGKIRQVVMNFIDNSIYYSREHSTITVKLYVDAGDAVLEVHDTGIGVPEDQKAQLFGKFFRATNARKQRPDGTGIGLFLAKKVIVSHGGSMVFESVEGDGSTFGFRLPIKKLSAVPAHDADQLEQ